MTRIVWMTDPHLQAEGDILGLDPRAHLSAAITHASTHYPDADFGILSGDLVGENHPRDYAALAEQLTASAFLIHPMMGNDDTRSEFRRHLTLPDGAMPDFVQYAIAIPEGQILCLDTHKPGSSAGQLCGARRDWLEAMLGWAPDTPTYIFMHHPPMALGLPRQDELMLEDADDFLDLIARHPQVRHLFMGHVHRPTCGALRGIPFSTLGALSFQAPPPRPDWQWGDLRAAPEAPHYATIDIRPDGAVLQFIQFDPA
ncbi:MAG: metallophosphoesterase [Marinibacterium sp.]|nr:metallophosphoesterase [Marinibacterium sp.]